MEAPLTRVEGSDLRLAVAAGPVSAVLVHCLRRYVYEIDDQLRPEDVVGWIPRGSVGADFESNHFSGTALAIRPRAYPIGAPDGLATRDATVVRDILAECEGVVGWGADAVPEKQSHFQIVVEPGDRALSDVAAKLAGWSTRPDRGPGTSVDPFSARRRRVAIDVKRAQGVLDR
ncbi:MULTISPECIES: hypothetical protein [unclassified Nocardioides]|uniref:hypothetical protein n=1 Tax=unclassified Nocardioides TaxID=2615069 RepID=UPI0030149C54